MTAVIGNEPVDGQTLELKAETLIVTKRTVTGATVRVSTVTREVEQAVDERLDHELVDVERVPIGRVVEVVPEIREEDGVTIVPVVEEVVVVERRLVLKEEVRITRRRVQSRHVETASLRRQEAVVTRIGPGESPASQSQSEAKPTSPKRGNEPMEHETIVAIYDTPAHAQAAVRDLEAANVPASDISQHAKEGSMTGTSRLTAPVHEKGFWASLFGGEPDHDTAVYGHSINSGATVVTVKVTSDRYDEAAAILEKHDPIDVDERAEQYGLTGTSTSGTSTTSTGYAGHGGKLEPAVDATEAGAIGASGLTARPAMGTDHGTTGVGTTGVDAGAVSLAEGAKSDTLQLAEEFLNVGKRAVRGGTTRIRRYTVEKPVEENVTLHNERVVLDRRPVTDGRVLANADFTDKTISMTEMNEEAVVSKTARVVEEIGLHKEASERVETVRDTLRKDDVEVEQVPTTERLETERFETSRTTPLDRKI